MVGFWSTLPLTFRSEIPEPAPTSVKTIGPIEAGPDREASAGESASRGFSRSFEQAARASRTAAAISEACLRAAAGKSLADEDALPVGDLREALEKRRQRLVLAHADRVDDQPGGAIPLLDVL